MPTILRRLPFFSDGASLRIPDGPAVAIKHHQIVIWVGLAPVGNPNPPRDMHRFPALLDTGFNGNFLLREDHLSDWAKTTLSESDYNMIGTTLIHGELALTFDADLWIFGNMPGFRDQVSDAPAFRMEFDSGIALCPAHMTRLRLPLLGLVALRKNGVRVMIDGKRKHVSMRGPD
ncbi:MAG: hypothetical protein EXS16_17320 [Gemmataceae bacterium]|nr:hypothetical protein [Gemmataceae bacterium]